VLTFEYVDYPTKFSNLFGTYTSFLTPFSSANLRTAAARSPSTAGYSITISPPASVRWVQVSCLSAFTSSIRAAMLVLYRSSSIPSVTHFTVWSYFTSTSCHTSSSACVGHASPPAPTPCPGTAAGR
jgi:hypothetical protein